MTPGALTAFGLLCFALAALPARDTLDVARFAAERGVKGGLPAAIGLLLVRIAATVIALGGLLLAFRVMPDVLFVAKVVAMSFIALVTLRRLIALKRPIAIADNDNMPEQSFTGVLRHAITGVRPEREIAMAAALAVLILPQAPLPLSVAEVLAIIYVAVMIPALAIFIAFARPLLLRLGAPRRIARGDRVEELLSSGLPRVSARFRKNAA